MVRLSAGNSRKTALVAVPCFCVVIVGLLLLQTIPAAQQPFDSARAAGDDVSSFFLAPIDSVVTALPLIGASRRAQTRIAELEDQMRQLAYWRQAARIMSERLAAYERILKLSGERPEFGIAARIVGEPSTMFSATRIANAGHSQGVAQGFAAIGQHGLVGRVIRTGKHTSRVLLLTDRASQIPVMGTVSHDRAILVGDGRNAARLRHAETPDNIQEGELWITSGDAGLLPRGLGVGVARRNSHGWYLDLEMTRSGLDFVRLVPPSYFPPPDDSDPDQ